MTCCFDGLLDYSVILFIYCNNAYDLYSLFLVLLSLLFVYSLDLLWLLCLFVMLCEVDSLIALVGLFVRCGFWR